MEWTEQELIELYENISCELVDKVFISKILKAVPGYTNHCFHPLISAFSARGLVRHYG